MLAAGPLGIAQAQRSSEPITLNFVNADIEAVARTMAAITGRNIVVDPRVKGTINLSTDRPVAPAAAYNQFLATLRLSGFTVVDAGGLLKVVPEADAKLQGGTVSVGAPGGRQPDRDADLPAELRAGRQPGADPAAADQPQQHHQRQPRQQLAGDHRLRRQPATARAHHRGAGRLQRHRRRGHPAAPRAGAGHRAGGAAPGRLQRRRRAAAPGQGQVDTLVSHHRDPGTAQQHPAWCARPTRRG